MLEKRTKMLEERPDNERFKDYSFGPQMEYNRTTFMSNVSENKRAIHST